MTVGQIIIDMENKTPFWKALVFALVALVSAFLIGYIIYTGGNLPI